MAEKCIFGGFEGMGVVRGGVLGGGGASGVRSCEESVVYGCSEFDSKLKSDWRLIAFDQ